MKHTLFKAVLAVTLLASSVCAHAIVNCSITSTGFSITNQPTVATAYSSQGSFDLTCTRGILDITSTNYTITVNNGNNPTGTQNRATLTGNTISYDTYKTNGCNTIWGNGAGQSFTGSVNIPSTTTINYVGCITTSGQYVPAGTYMDTVTMSLTYDTSLLGLTTATTTNTFPVSVINPAVCSITSVGNIGFGAYTAFRATPLVSPNANIVVNCTPSLSYSLALDANSGVVSGLNYTLTINSLVPPVNSSGTGPGQTHIMTGTMPANQVGSCATSSCSGSDPRTLIITY